MKKIVLSLLIASSVHASNWDVEYWQYFRKKHVKGEILSVYTSGEVRLDKDITRFYYYRLTENVAVRPFCWLDLEAHYSFIYSKPRGASSFNTRSRIELEINPLIHFSNGVTAQWRNRLELIRKQHITEFKYILRERLLVKVPFCFCPIVSFHCFDEVFYDFDLKKVTENRLAPLACSLSFCGINLDLFFMIRNFYNGQWYKSFVFGSEIFF